MCSPVWVSMWSVSADVETFGARRHLVEELATPHRAGSTRHVAEVLHQSEAIDAEILVAAHGVGVDGSRQRRDDDLELAQLGRPVDLIREASELLDRGLGVLEVLEEAVPALAPLDCPTTGRGREPAGDDR